MGAGGLIVRAPSPPAEPLVNAMTVDLEDYFHVSVFDGIVPRSEWNGMESRVRCNTERLLALFDDFHVRATFFVLGWVAERQPQLVRMIADAGHEIASHGYAHRLIYDQTPAAFRDDVSRAKRVLEDAANRAVHGYRAPSYSVTPRSLWALDILIDEGYAYDASIFPIRHDRYGIPVSPRLPYSVERPGGTIIEIPASTVRLGPLNVPVAGGGYFRILPYGWTRWGIAELNRQRVPAVFYIHPWEIDPGQPRLQAGWLGRFRHYRNLDKTEGRLRALLREFRFAPVRTLLCQSAALNARNLAAAPLPYLW